MNDRSPRAFSRLTPILMALGLSVATGGSAAETDSSAAQAPAASQESVTYSGGDGTSLQQAVVISAPNSRVGVDAEYRWILQRFPGAQPTGTSLLMVEGRAYDSIDVRMPKGETRTFYFDISSFFGKF